MKVQVFLHGPDGKVGRGTFDFFEEEVAYKFVKYGGYVTVRTPHGDVGMEAKPQTLPNALKELPKT